MTARITPNLDDQVTEPVDDLRVVVEVRGCLNVPDRTQPLRDPVELAELLLERRENR